MLGPLEEQRAPAPAGMPSPPVSRREPPRSRNAALNDAPSTTLLLGLLALLVIIAFSSGTEVAMLSLNRYRIRHHAQSGHSTAKVLERLLLKPDDWLGANLVILAAASVFASATATILAQRTGYTWAVPITGFLLTVIVIVFCELAPKIYAATHPEFVALGAARIYTFLVLVARPVLWCTNKMAYGFLRIFGVGRSSRASQALSSEELRTVVAEAGTMIPARHRQMLLSILDLGQITVNDIMIPRQEIAAIDVQENWDDILDQLRQTPHTRLPVYDGELDNLIGILHMKRVVHELARGTLTRDRLVEIARNREPYFVPEETSLNVQLSQFQRNRRRLAFVVNEYGDIEGIVTLEDILEEIVGEFTSDPASITHKDVHVERPGVYIVNASATIRALNRALQWQLPTDGPKTLNGLLLEQLETIPDPGTALKVGPYQFEILQIADNAIKTVRVKAEGADKPVTVASQTETPRA
jgi:Mg2+/Co2+ transporter CorB